jgi:hypothetical protein
MSTCSHPEVALAGKVDNNMVSMIVTEGVLMMMTVSIEDTRALRVFTVYERISDINMRNRLLRRSEVLQVAADSRCIRMPTVRWPLLRVPLSLLTPVQRLPPY